MNKKICDLIFSFLGFYLIIVGVIAVFNSIINPEIANFLWLCYITLILIGFGIFFKNYFLIVLQLNIVFIPILIWNVDFFYRLISGRFLFGFTKYIFDGGINSVGNFISLSHLIILPLAIFFLYNYKIKRKDLWKFSFLEVGIFFFMSFFLTSPELNTNCVFDSCIPFISSVGVDYYLLWFTLFFAMIFFTNCLLVKIFFKK
jgi:hypothetical protein